jgi:hypothetical protein
MFDFCCSLRRQAASAVPESFDVKFAEVVFALQHLSPQLNDD